MQFWYWELVETARRLLLTAVLSVVSTGSSAQVVFGIAIALVYMKLYGFYQPYDLDEHDVMQVRFLFLIISLLLFQLDSHYHIASLLTQELAQYQVFITLFVGLLIRDDALTGLVWVIVLDVLLTITNSSTSIAAMLFVFKKQESWDNKPFKSLFSCMTRLLAVCCRRRRGRKEGREESARKSNHVDLDQTVDSPVLPSPMPLPSTIFQFTQHPASTAKIHSGPSSEKSVEIALPSSSSSAMVREEEEKGYITFDASMSATLLRPMETTDQVPGPDSSTRPNRSTLRTSIKDQLVAMRASGKGLVDRLKTSTKSREIGTSWSSLSEKGQKEIESRQSLLAVLPSDTEEEELQIDRIHTTPVRTALHSPLGPPLGVPVRNPLVQQGGQFPHLGPSFVPPVRNTLGRQAGQRRKRSQGGIDSEKIRNNEDDD